MSAAVTLLATAAATVGAVSALRLVKRRLIEAERRVEAVRRKQAARRDAGILDLEPDDATGIYRVPPPGRIPPGGARPDDSPAEGPGARRKTGS